jgi:hypothetical protein
MQRVSEELDFIVHFKTVGEGSWMMVGRRLVFSAVTTPELLIIRAAFLLPSTSFLDRFCLAIEPLGKTKDSS